MMRIATLLALAVLVAASAAAGTAGANRRSAAGQSLDFCTDPTFPPMELATTSGKIVGFDIDMAAAIGRVWQGSSKPVKTAFPGLLPALGAKKCDAVLSGIFVTPDRTKQFPAVTYMHSHRVLLVRAGNPKGIKRPNDLKGKNVAVQGGTKYEQYLKGLKGRIGFSLQSYPGDTDAVAQLLLGRADAVLTQDTSAAYQIGKHPGKLKIAYLFPQQDSFGVYYRKGEAIGGKLKSAVATLRKNGTLAKLAAKYKLPAADVK
ncbi:MAG: transporter substrate-binding domain-containing protein [Gaiellaceae bacterium]